MTTKMNQQTYQHIDARIAQRMQEARTPSLVLGLTNREQLLRTTAYGYTEIESQTPATPETLFEIGSISKTFAAVVTLRTAEAGRIDLQAPVTEYLPWFKVKNQFAPITIHHLLSHTAGLPYGMDFSPDPQAIVYSLRAYVVPHAPGERFHYSECGYQTLTLVLQAIYGKPYAEILTEQVFKPLGMNNSHAVITHALRPQLARGYTILYDDRPAHSSHPIVPAQWIEFNSCDGAVASTAADMTKFMRMLLTDGVPLISPERFKQLYTEVVPGTAYGYGFISWEDEGIRYMGHAGDMPGYEAYLWMDYTNGLGAVILCSMPYPGNLCFDVLHTLKKAHQGEPLPEFKASDPTRIENAGDYAGRYAAGEKRLALVAEGQSLYLDLGDLRPILETRGPDTFLIPHSDYNLFPLEFIRAGESTPVTAIHHGPNVYVPEGADQPKVADYPPEWEAYVGHYRTWNPWEPNFRIILRGGQLFLVHPDGETEELVIREDGAFHLGDDPLTPEFIRFDQVVAGQALRANLSGVDYYRFFTP